MNRIAGFQKIAHHGTARCRANAIVLFLEDVDNHLPNVTVIIDDENMLRLAHRSSHHRGKFPGSQTLASLDCDLVEAMCR
jgi:hypothetical protein